jgi:glyoxylase-like metal-dependent hydrolase (beta-lactamase superfamily II)
MSTPRFSELSDWFKLNEVGPDIFRITEPGYREDYLCNIHLVKGSERDMLIDTGLGVADLKAFLSTLSPEPLLVCSLAHYDHIGSNWQFAERVGHRAEADIFSAPTRQNTYADPVLQTEDFHVLPWRDFNANQWEPKAAPLTGFVEDGDLIDLGNRQFEVLHTPGHSWGSICLWEAATNIMFSADTVYAGELFDFLPCLDIPTYIHSMQRLREYPVRTALPCHGPVLDRKRYQLVIGEYLERHHAD